jgi:CO/xanthine dehydrogenase Mo-binding subunit
MTTPKTTAAIGSNIGKSLPRLEARDKVTGRTEYTHHLRLPGMLYGKILRSTVPHGRIKRIDTAAAAALEGVYQVVTIDDVRKVIPNPYYGPAFHDQPILADGKVRFAGEPVAVVLASDKRVAEAALGLIEVEYDEMPGVYDEVEAMTSNVLVHDELKPATTFPDLAHLKGRKATNIALDYKLRHGDTETAFAKADHVFEHTFRAQQCMHTPMEPFVSIANYKGGADPRDAHLTLHTASQGPSFVRIEIARLIGLPENKVRVKVPFLGGGFGGKLYIKLEALVTALSMIARRPVKISLTMEEQFFMVTRHPCTFTIKSGVTKEGKILARHCEVVWNGGAYADIGPRVTQKGGFTSAGPYDIDNVTINSYAVYTNRPPCGALRGFGAPQTAWAYECHADMIANALGIDRVEFRRKNILREGRPQASGTPLRDAEIEKAMDQVLDRLGWSKPIERGTGRFRRGRGIAIGFKGITAPTTSVAIVNLYGDGSCGLYIGTVDMGQGSDTVMAQIAAEVLNLDATKIRVIHPDTDVTPYDMGTLGSRSTFHMGNAVRRAADDAKAKIAALAKDLGLPEGTNMPLSDMLKRRYGMQAGNIIGTGSFIPDYEKPDLETGQTKMGTPFWGVGTAGAEVEVDTETGHFTILKLVNVADVGTALNPKAVRQQLSGSGIMQLGHTITEAMVFRDGQLTNGSLADYKIPSLLDMPVEYINEHVPGAYDKEGPFGAKGTGESTSIALSPAIGNAIADAIGVHITDLPITPEAVYRAIQKAKGTPLPETDGA